MSIPGLGQIPEQPATTTTRQVLLPPGAEYRFTALSPTTVRLLSGTAELSGVELAPRTSYVLSTTSSKILTWQGCELDVEGSGANGFVKEYPTPADNPESVWLSLHAKLQELRAKARKEQSEGPRILIAGGAGVGKSTIAKTLTSYATRQGGQPLAVNLSPKDGMLSFPGSLSASVFATILDVEAADSWGSTPASGPSVVPVKLPLVFSYGRKGMTEDGDYWRELVSRLAGSVSGRLSEDEDVRSTGVVIDTESVDGSSHEGIDLLLHAIDEFSGSPSLSMDLTQRLASEKTSLGEPVQVIALEKSDGAAPREDSLAQHAREAAIKEYFFGGTRRTLSPQIQHVDFDALTIYTYPEYPDQGILVKEDPSAMMEHWTLAVMNASPKDSPEAIRTASVMGYVYVSDVDEERKKVKILAPVSGKLSDRPLLFGKWPEPYMNLLG